MALILVHVRRLILLLSIVYLSGAFVRKLLTDSRSAYLQQLTGGKHLWVKQLHFQWWAYIYTGYAYVVLVNYVAVHRFNNMLEFFLT